MLTHIVFSLSLISAGSIQHIASYPTLEPCELQVRRLQPQFEGTGRIMACLPTNQFNEQAVAEQMKSLARLLSNTAKEMDKQ